MKKITIAIDGFSSCGKSTMAKDLAKEIGYIYVDSGAMYRAVTLFAMQNGLFNEQGVDVDALEDKIQDVHISFQLDAETQRPVTYLNNINVEQEIRGMEVSSRVSHIAALGFVRTAMVKLQQEMGKEKGIVMDGRDIGTTVFPNAELKIFMTADPMVRAERRAAEMRAKGEDVNIEDVLRNLQERDYIDSHREVSPLVQAEDAVVLDNSHMTFDDQMVWIKELIAERFGA